MAIEFLFCLICQQVFLADHRAGATKKANTSLHALLLPPSSRMPSPPLLSFPFSLPSPKVETKHPPSQKDQKSHGSFGQVEYALSRKPSMKKVTNND